MACRRWDMRRSDPPRSTTGGPVRNRIGRTQAVERKPVIAGVRMDERKQRSSSRRLDAGRRKVSRMGGAGSGGDGGARRGWKKPGLTLHRAAGARRQQACSQTDFVRDPAGIDGGILSRSETTTRRSGPRPSIPVSAPDARPWPRVANGENIDA